MSPGSIDRPCVLGVVSEVLLLAMNARVACASTQVRFVSVRSMPREFYSRRETALRARAWNRAMTLLGSRLLGATLLLLLAACGPKRTPGTTASNAASPLVVAVDPRLIEMVAEPTTTLVTASASSQLGLRIQIRALELPESKRPALNLTLVLDTSGSMQGDAIDALRSSANKLIEQLRDGDRVAVVAFHSKVDVLVPGTAINPAARKRIAKAIGGIVARGTTDLAAGLAVGLEQVRAGHLASGINRIVLLSDGVPNTGTSLPALIAAAHQAGIGVTTLGLGVDYDTTLLTQMARDTGGTFHYIETPDTIASVFNDELTKMTTVVGRNLQLALAPGPGVTIEPMPGLVAGGDGKLYATIGDLAAGEKRDLMIPIKLAARGDGSTAELVDATLSFDDVVNRSGRLSRDAFVAVKTSKDAVAVRKAVKIDLEVQRVRTAAASAILEAITLARQNQLDLARKRLANAAEVVRAASTRLQDPELAKIGSQLDEVAKQLAQLVPQQIVAEPAHAKGGIEPTTSMAMPRPAVAPVDVEIKLRRAQDTATKTVSGQHH